MKNQVLNSVFSIVMMLSLSVSNAFPKEVMGDFYASPLLLNGREIDFALLSSLNTGKISIGQLYPKAVSKIKVRFYIYLRRAGKIVDTNSTACTKAVTEFEMADILKLARAGDHIEIVPAGENERAAKRIIVVQQHQLWPKFQWFQGLYKSKEGC